MPSSSSSSSLPPSTSTTTAAINRKYSDCYYCYCDQNARGVGVSTGGAPSVARRPAENYYVHLFSHKSVSDRQRSTRPVLIRTLTPPLPHQKIPAPNAAAVSSYTNCFLFTPDQMPFLTLSLSLPAPLSQICHQPPPGIVRFRIPPPPASKPFHVIIVITVSCVPVAGYSDRPPISLQRCVYCLRGDFVFHFKR